MHCFLKPSTATGWHKQNLFNLRPRFAVDSNKPRKIINIFVIPDNLASFFWQDHVLEEKIILTQKVSGVLWNLLCELSI